MIKDERRKWRSIVQIILKKKKKKKKKKKIIKEFEYLASNSLNRKLHYSISSISFFFKSFLLLEL